MRRIATPDTRVRFTDEPPYYGLLVITVAQDNGIVQAGVRFPYGPPTLGDDMSSCRTRDFPGDGGGGCVEGDSGLGGTTCVEGVPGGISLEGFGGLRIGDGGTQI